MTVRSIAQLNRLAELAEALIAADQRRLAHWCYAWGFALDPSLSGDSPAQQQVRANLALSAMLHPALAAELREARLDQLVERLCLELGVAQRSGADLLAVKRSLRRFQEASGLPVSGNGFPELPESGTLAALSPLVWPYTLPRVELLGPITAFRLVLLGNPDAEVYPWLPQTDHNWVWIWTGDLSALESWLRRKTDHLGPLHGEAQRALAHLGQLVGPVDPDADDRDRQLTRDLNEALSELHRALYVERLSEEASLVAAFLAAMHGEPVDVHEAWLNAQNLPELLARIAGARHRRGSAKALRVVEKVAGLKSTRT